MPSDSRRSFLSRIPAIMAITGLSGCTALTSTNTTITFVNDYKYKEKEKASFYIRRGNKRSQVATISLSPGEERVFTRSMKRGHSVVVTKPNNRLSFTFQRSVCLDPVLEVNISGGIAGGWSC
ncbi:hypothetical protein [Haloprofundus salinisoli]|uniref:hypothetical protein n=1 Tax=Haloprofundus salinisoli TaxID=2876193 RepID=UPI001CCB1921|nr:hypothetical protein [Haloprofundus salinisoli]